MMKLYYLLSLLFPTYFVDDYPKTDVHHIQKKLLSKLYTINFSNSKNLFLFLESNGREHAVVDNNLHMEEVKIIFISNLFT